MSDRLPALATDSNGQQQQQRLPDDEPPPPPPPPVEEDDVQLEMPSMPDDPLSCGACLQELSDAVVVGGCLHTLCAGCGSNSNGRCPVCANDATVSRPATPDALSRFLVSMAHEPMEVCANCDEIRAPMYFCETCQQVLCNACRADTHQARMFRQHAVLPLEERSRMGVARPSCSRHGQPNVLFGNDDKRPACLKCFEESPLERRASLISIDAAHSVACKKIEKVATQLREYHTELADAAELRRRLVNEKRTSHNAARKSLLEFYQHLIAALTTARDEELARLDEQRASDENASLRQLDHIRKLILPVQFHLVAAQMLCSSAAKLDLLHFQSELTRRMQHLLSKCDSLERPSTVRSPADLVDARQLFARCLEPLLGMANLMATNERATREGSSACTAWHLGGASSGSGGCCATASISRPSRFQLLVDLAGAFGELFAKVDTPLRDQATELAELSRFVQEAQRDLTVRRRLLKVDELDDLRDRCERLFNRTHTHVSTVAEVHPQLQLLWQEQLDRVRRQQTLLREKSEETRLVREVASQVAAAARQLRPFAETLEAATKVIDLRRCHPPDPAPMEQICAAICELEPDSAVRCLAIEKEEQNRKAVQMARRQEELDVAQCVVKSLKPSSHKRTRSGSGQKRSPTRHSHHHHHHVVESSEWRDRSPGGTDRNLRSPLALFDLLHQSSSGHRAISSSSMASEDLEQTCQLDIEFYCVDEQLGTDPQSASICVDVSAPMPRAPPASDQERASPLKSPTAAVTPDQPSQLPSPSHPPPPPPPPPPCASLLASLSAQQSPGSFEQRERLLESLRERVARIDVGATKSPPPSPA